MAAASLQSPPGAPGVTDHGGLAGLADDDHLQYLLLAGRAGGQTANGGTAGGQELVLRGTAAANLGAIRCQSPLIFDDTIPSAASQYFVDATPTQVTTAGFVGGGMSFAPVITFGASTAIWEGFRVGAIVDSSVNLGFSALTLMQALPRGVSAVSGRNPITITVLNAGPLHEYTGAAGSVNCQTFGMNWSPQLRASTSGGTLNWTTATCLDIAPKYSTVLGGTANMGTVIGMRGRQPAQGLFAPGAGTQTLANYIMLDVDALTFPTSGDTVVIRSAMTDAADRFFLQNLGGARSTLGGGDLLDVGLVELLGDTVGEAVQFGAGGDARIYFDGTDLILDARVVVSPAAVRIPHALVVSSPGFPAVLIERTTASTVGVLSGYRHLATTSGNMADTFGTSVFWAIQDDALVVNNIGYQSCTRFGGADNTGRWQKYVYLGGVATEVSRIDTLQTYVMMNGGTFRTGGGRLKKITRIDSGASPYTLLASDHVLFVDTDGGAVTVNLPAGVLDTEHRVVNVGTSANNVTLTPNGAELLYGVAGTFAITDGLEARIGYETTEGWF